MKLKDAMNYCPDTGYIYRESDKARTKCYGDSTIFNELPKILDDADLAADDWHVSER